MSKESRRPIRLTTPRPLNGPPRQLFWVGPIDVMGRLSKDTLAQALPQGPALFELTAMTLLDLEEALTSGTDAAAVLSPLFWRGGDGVETARLLEKLSFRQPYRILAPDLPRPELVLRELRLVSPNVDIDLLPLGYPDIG